MSREVLSAISHSYDLATYSTPELRGLFNEWLSEIEIEVFEFLKDKKRVDPDEVARHLKLERESIVFILNKLARDGKINMQESGM